MPLPALVSLLVCLGLCAAPLPAADDDPALALAARAVLEARCVRCHGEQRQKGGLRLDSRPALLAIARGGRAAIEPSDPGASALIERVTTADPDERMPAEGEALDPAEIETLRRWIAAGAAWPRTAGPTLDGRGPDDAEPEGSQRPADGGAPRETATDARAADQPHGPRERRPSSHWAYHAPERPPLPALPPAGEAWVRNPVDRFVLARLLADGLTPAPAADRATLLRRLSLDLTGLPPTLAELDAFLADERPDAYERVVQRLLTSPARAEHQTRLWLDLARYADSRGYEKDEPRSMWRWRDWVLDAYAADLPFDRFTVEQLAGDLLPDATREQRLATGFHRNTMVNEEGGVDAEEYRAAALVDRVNTTAQVWLGSTLGCAQCHDHKHDPFSQRDYYSLYAFFDGTLDDGVSEAPLMDAPRPEDEALAAEVGWQLEATRRVLERQTPELDAELAELVTRARAERVTWAPARPVTAVADEGVSLRLLDDGSLLAFGPNPKQAVYELDFTCAEVGGPPLTGLRLELLTDESLPEGGPGRSRSGLAVLSELSLRPRGADGVLGEPVCLRAAVADTDVVQEDASPAAPGSGAAAIDGELAGGWSLTGDGGVDHQLVVAFAEPLRALRFAVRLDQLDSAQRTLGRFRVAFTSDPLPVAPVVLPPACDVSLLAATATGVASGADALAALSEGDRLALASWFRAGPSRLLAGTRRRAQELGRGVALPTALVMQEVEQPRETHVHRGGSFLSPGERVWPDTPAVLPPVVPRDGTRADRLDLARWLVSPGNPLTARVAVNRAWQSLFGRGLVATPDDFGAQGERPVHPELLDWLAREFVARSWSQRELLRLLVTSATYRQASALTPLLAERDPDNLLLARSTRWRVDAETVRDVALSVSGLLAPRFGGPSVYPPQPEGTWAATYSAARWVESSGADRHRRGLYTFWRRTSPHPTLQLFDAPTRELACPRRDRTNTPLQALALLNDPAFVEAAGALALRVLAWDGADDAARVAYGFRSCTGRRPEPRELAVLLELLERERAQYEFAPSIDPADGRASGLPGDAAALVAAACGMVDGPAPGELAAWIVLANTLLNLDETITRS